MISEKKARQSDSEAQTRGAIRALIVDLSKRYGGAATRTIELACQLQASGACVAGLSDSPVIRAAKKQGLPVANLGRSRTDPAIPFRISRLIRAGGYQVIDTQNIQSQFWGSIASLLTNTALVSTLNSWYETEHGGSLKGKFYTAIEMWTKSQTDQYIAVSEEVRAALLRAGVAESSVKLIHNTIDIDPDAIVEDPVAFRRELGFPEDAIVCVSVGRLVWAKGYEDFITAFGKVAGRLSNLYAVIVGEGILHEQLLILIQQAGLKDRFLLLGYRDRDAVLKILKSSNIFVMPSRTEGTPLALLEAAALGKPILATRCGGIPEIVTDRVDALLVPVGDVSMLAEALAGLCADPDHARSLGARARTTIELNFNSSSLAENTRNVYFRALEHRSTLLH